MFELAVPSVSSSREPVFDCSSDNVVIGSSLFVSISLAAVAISKGIVVI